MMGGKRVFGEPKVAVVQRILDAFVRQTEALLGHVHPQHARESRPAG
jgi:hypothetical protein